MLHLVGLTFIYYDKAALKNGEHPADNVILLFTFTETLQRFKLNFLLQFYSFTCHHVFLHISLSKGAKARGGPRPPSRVSSTLPGLGRLFSTPGRRPSTSPVFTLLVFVTRDFSEVGESVQCSTPNLEDQGTSLSLAPPLRPVCQR